MPEKARKLLTNREVFAVLAPLLGLEERAIHKLTIIIEGPGTTPVKIITEESVHARERRRAGQEDGAATEADGHYAA